MINRRFSYRFVERYKSVWIYLITCPDGSTVYAAKDSYGHWLTEGKTIELVKEKVDLLE